MSTLVSSTASPSDDPRPPKLDISALSPSEYPLYSRWIRGIAKSPSGEEGYLDEQDALAWLRKECAVGRVDEVKILSLFERYPLGLEAGHFFALLRLVAWAQQGQTPRRSLIFTQTLPPTTGLAAGTTFPLPGMVAAIASKPAQQPESANLSTGSIPISKKMDELKTTRTPAVSTIVSQQQQPSVSTPSSKVPPPILAVTPSPSSSQLPTPLVPVASASTITPHEPSQRAASSSMLPPPVPPDSSKPSRSPGPSNPFRERHNRSTSLAVSAAADPLSGFDPAPNPFKPVKPKVIRPTPIVATAGQPNPVTSAADPSGVPGISGFSSRSVKSVEDGPFPPLPPRPDGEKPPPPLPPRAHISPLIQAGLQASKQVRQQKDALPPKTFTVLQSSTSRSRHEARLLTGESAPPNVQAELPPPPTHHAKRKVSLHEAKRSVSEANTGVLGARRPGSDDGHEGPQRAASQTATVIAAPKPSRPSHSRHHLKGRGSESASGGDGSHHHHHQSSVAAPKAQYADGSGSTRTKPPTLPSWLREQEELQRSALAEGKPLFPPSDHGQSARDLSDEQQRKDFIRNFERSRHEPTVLDEEFDVFPSELSEQASRAASIDRPHNPFLHRSSQVEAEKLKLQPLLRQHQNHREREKQKERDRLRETEEHFSLGSRSPELNRPLGRSKTLQGKGPPPPPPSHGTSSRKRLESFPATLNSGTFAGFGRAGQGGLRLMPPSAKADVGLKSGEEARRPVARRGSSALSMSDRSSGAAPASYRGDEDSGETSLNSTNPTSVQELAQSVERRVSSQSSSNNVKARSDSNGGPASLKEKVSEFLKLQDGPPKGSRPIDDLKRDALRLAERKGWINRRGEESLLREEDEEEEEEEENQDGDSSLDSLRRRHLGGAGPWYEEPEEEEIDDQDDNSNEHWDDAAMPDDTYMADRHDAGTATGTVTTDTSDTPTPTIGDGSPERSRATPPPPPRRSASVGMPSSSSSGGGGGGGVGGGVDSTAAAPIARRASGYVARRASKIEARTSSSSPSSSTGLAGLSSRNGSGSASASNGGANGGVVSGVGGVGVGVGVAGTTGPPLGRSASLSIRRSAGGGVGSGNGHHHLSSSVGVGAGMGMVGIKRSPSDASTTTAAAAAGSGATTKTSRRASWYDLSSSSSSSSIPGGGGGSGSGIGGGVGGGGGVDQRWKNRYLQPSPTTTQERRRRQEVEVEEEEDEEEEGDEDALHVVGGDADADADGDTVEEEEEDTSRGKEVGWKRLE